MCKFIVVTDSSVVSDLNSSSCSRASQSSLVEDMVDDHHLKLSSTNQNGGSSGVNTNGTHHNSETESSVSTKANVASSRTQNHIGLSTSGDRATGVEEQERSLISAIEELDVEESVKSDLMSNLNLNGTDASAQENLTKRKSTLRRSSSLGSHGSGSTDSILNEAEEQIRMTTSGLDLGLSSGKDLAATL